MRRALLISLYCFLLMKANAQESEPHDSAEAKTLQQVTITAYAQNRRLAEVPAAISFVGHAQLSRFSNLSILPALNMNPGVRMEERSPGSYRINIRGSSLRSPFGVRDVKVYWNEIPLTDPGGNTYINQLGFYNFQSIQIIKGPAGSLYGAGIGGAVLINSMPSAWEQGADLNVTVGTYNTKSINGTVRFGADNARNIISYTHQSSDGYRQQSAMRRDIASWESVLKQGTKQILRAYILYGDLYYQTPGALNKKEYDANPQQARPPAGPTPGAVQNKAAIYQKTFTAGFAGTWIINNDWQNTTSVYGAYTDFSNPSIRVYEKRTEPHFGGRSIFQFKKLINETQWQFNAGVEAQKGFFNTRDFSNKQGNLDTLQTDDNIGNWQYMIFAQADVKLAHDVIITAGASFNKSAVQFTRLSVSPVTQQSRNFENKVAPRIAVLKKIGLLSVYASAARGFSTPTVSELLRSSGTIGYNLQPEDGIDYEVGIRGNFLGGKLFVDINSFFFHLNNTIVQRIDTNNVYYYVNAGSTRQNGVEALVSYIISDHPDKTVSYASVWTSYTYHHFHYHDFKQAIDANTIADYSGKQLPGVAPNTFVAGLDIKMKIGFYTNLTYTFSDKLPLNDMNTAYADGYHLMTARIGYAARTKKWKLDFFAGADNLFNGKYSLGNDINAAAGRYYNAAAPRNYYGGISVGNIWSK